MADRLAAEIRAGRWQPGERLPPACVLARRFDVHRHTVRKSLEWLRAQGLLEPGGALARIAALGLLPVPLAACADLRTHLHRLGVEAECTGLASSLVNQLPSALQARLPLGSLPGPLLRLRYQVEVNGAPIAHTEAYFPAMPAVAFEADPEAGAPLQQVLRQRSATPVHARHAWVEAGPSCSGSGVLRGRAVLRLCVLAVDAGRQPVKLCCHSLDADRVRLAL